MLEDMETPAGFTKVSAGKYTKGDNTYVVNPVTGAVTLDLGSQSGGEKTENDEDDEIDTTLPGQYGFFAPGYEHVRYFVINNDNTFSLFDTDDNDVREQSGTYVYDSNTNTVTLDVSGAQTAKVYFIKNNKILWIPTSGASVFTTNGLTGMELPDSNLLGIYSNGTNTKEVSIETVEMGEATITYGAVDKDIGFMMIDGNIVLNLFSDEDISFTQSGADTILTFDGVSYTKQ